LYKYQAAKSVDLRVASRPTGAKRPDAPGARDRELLSGGDKESCDDESGTTSQSLTVTKSPGPKTGPWSGAKLPMRSAYGVQFMCN
jgi:hypothetical protein